jgi:hypothetical protein
LESNHLVDRSRSRSGGERQRIAVARALARDPTIILADEPTANLDPKLSEDIIEYLKNWCRERDDRTVIWVTHDVHLAARYADQVIVLRNGRLLADLTWPQPNPRDPQMLRNWIDGNPVPFNGAGESAAMDKKTIVQPRVAFTTSSEDRRPDKDAVSPLGVWIRIGISQILDGPQSDRVRWLRQLTSVAPITSKEDESWPPLAAYWNTFGAKLSACMLSLLVATVAVLSIAVDRMSQTLRDRLASPTLNPVVVSSRASITNRALADLRDSLGETHPEVLNGLSIFGRYELPGRRVTLPISQQGETNANPCSARRSPDAMLLDIAGIDPAESMLARLVAEPAASHLTVDLDLRVDGMWPALLSKSARDRLRNLQGAPEQIQAICVGNGLTWISAKVASVLQDPPRSRNGPYDVILSGSLLRDYGQITDKNLYQTAAVYFSADPALSGIIVRRVRELASQTHDLPNTKLVQSLSNEAGFERIAAALDSTRSSETLISVLTGVFGTVIALILLVFISQHFEVNLKAICVSMAFGAGFRGIVAIQLTRLLLIFLPTIGLAALIGITFVTLNPLGLLYGIDMASSSLSEFMRRYAFLIVGLAFGSIVLTIVVTALWLLVIRRRSLGERLKDID